MSIHIHQRHDISRQEWDGLCHTHPSGWFWHTSDWLDYCLAYDPSATHDRSFGVYDDQILVAVVPVLFDITTRQTVAGGSPVAMPLTMPGYEYVIQQELDRWFQQSPPVGTSDVTMYVCRTCALTHTKSDALGIEGTVFDRESQIIDLQEPEPALWSNLRKSYRSLIHQQLERYDMVVPLATDIHTLREYHTKQAGRETRPRETWNIMGRWLASGTAHAMTAVSKETDDVCGFVYVICYKNQAYYASGGSNGQCGHALQWTMLQHLKERHIEQYEIGWQDAGEDHKARNIAFFKRGFGGLVQPFVFITRTY